MISKIIKLIQSQYLNIILGLASFGLSAWFFRFKSYFSLREVFLLPDNKNFKYQDSLLEFLNYQTLQFGISSESFYSIFFTLLFFCGVMATYFSFYKLIRLVIQIREINYEDGVNFFAVQITTKIAVFLFSVFTIYNPITLKFFLLGSVTEIVAYFSLPVLLCILISWLFELSQISIFRDIKSSQSFNVPTLMISLRSTFFVSVFLLASLILNLSFTYIVSISAIIFLVLVLVLVFDFRKAYFYRPSIYIEESKKYTIILSNTAIKYLAYPLVVFLPAVIVYFIYKINPDIRNRSDFFANIYPYQNIVSSEVRLGDWYNINWSIFNEIMSLEKLFGSVAKFSVFFNQYIHWIIIGGFILLMTNWLISSFKSFGILLYINTFIALCIGLIGAGYLSTYLLNFRIFYFREALNHNHLYIIIAVLIFIISVLSVLDILKNFVKWHLQLNLVLIIALLLLVTCNILPFTLINQIVNYTSLNTAYGQLNQKCTNKTKVLELPKQVFIKDFKTGKITKNPLYYLSKCEIVDIDSVQLELDVIIGLGGKLTKEKTSDWLEKLKAENISFLVLNTTDNTVTSLYNQISSIKAPLIVQGEIIIYNLDS